MRRWKTPSNWGSWHQHEAEERAARERFEEAAEDRAASIERVDQLAARVVEEAKLAVLKNGHAADAERLRLPSVALGPIASDDPILEALPRLMRLAEERAEMLRHRDGQIPGSGVHEKTAPREERGQ